LPLNRRELDPSFQARVAEIGGRVGTRFVCRKIIERNVAASASKQGGHDGWQAKHWIGNSSTRGEKEFESEDRML